MKESQNIEFKETWRDEYLKWICGFANAEGGALVIGKNDKGAAVGVSNAAKLLEDLPNKIRDVLGVMADVRLVKEAGKELVEVRVAPYPSPISCRGEYHYRSGSTKQELKGAALDRFILRKYRSELKALIPALLERWQPVIGARVNGWGIKRMKTRWGTCTPKAGRIWLNLELAKKPVRCLEYIVVHELVHLLERHHDDKFVSLMDKHLPQWRARQQELNAAPLANATWEY